MHHLNLAYRSKSTSDNGLVALVHRFFNGFGCRNLTGARRTSLDAQRFHSLFASYAKSLENALVERPPRTIE